MGAPVDDTTTRGLFWHGGKSICNGNSDAGLSVNTDSPVLTCSSTNDPPVMHYGHFHQSQGGGIYAFGNGNCLDKVGEGMSYQVWVRQGAEVHEHYKKSCKQLHMDVPHAPSGVYRLA